MSLPSEHLKRAFAIDINYHDIAVCGCERTIHYRKIAIKQASEDHRITRDPNEEGRRPVRDQ
ncbi:hypothetical protein F8B43_5390 [Methylorubrum populi]|uniref:Uncharacterized protein n=1 Tax=Methylorubrum populi TaxID=223967 RepID=A0A833J163_9HYPH|nr:hypothetical protein F8B43_5390 [Methylorubrum populi]